MKKTNLVLLTAGLLSVGPLQVEAKRIYIKTVGDANAWANVAQDDNNIVKTVGTGGDYADFTSIDFNGTGLNIITGDEMWVAKGAYVFQQQLPTITNSVSIYGGFVGTETAVSQRAKSDIDGNGMIEPWEFTNETKFAGKGNGSANKVGYYLIKLNNGKTLDGVTLGDIYYENSGGTTYGGGGQVETGALIRNCIVKDITTICTSNNGVTGGGMYINRGGMESCLVENCVADITASGNGSTVQGGGIAVIGSGGDNTSACTGYVINSVVRNCQAGSASGANQSQGGGIFANVGARIENCVVYNNSSFAKTNAQAGGVFSNTSGNNYLKGCYFVNLTIVNNESANGNTAGAYPPFFPSGDYDSVYNSIVWNNAGSNSISPNQSVYTPTIRISANAKVGYPYLDYLFYNKDATTPIVNIANNQCVAPIFWPKFIEKTGTDEDPVGAGYPEFTNPTDFIGRSTFPMDLPIIKKANWTLKSSSPLLDNVGAATPTNNIAGRAAVLYTKSTKIGDSNDAFTFSPTDLMGKTRSISAWVLGAYQSNDYPLNISTKTASTVTIINEGGVIAVSGLSGNAQINVIDLNGSQLKSVATFGETINVSIAKKGVVLVQVTDDNGSYSSKVVL